MKVIGLTGSIGMGKSTVARMFADCGAPVFDADAEVHLLQAPGAQALVAIEDAFPGTTGPDGLDRAALGKAVFSDRAALKRLERIMHPLVGEVQARFLRTARYQRQPYVILDIPLLFEKGGWRRVDASVVVSAPAHIQAARVMARSGMTTEKLAAIRATQMPDAEKRARADFIVETGRGMRVTRLAVDRLAACFATRSLRYCQSCEKSSSIPRRRASTQMAATGFAKSARSN
ncbi:MAG: dephospho-CoA kinase [Pacificimonas sp.]